MSLSLSLHSYSHIAQFSIASPHPIMVLEGQKKPENPVDKLSIKLVRQFECGRNGDLAMLPIVPLHHPVSSNDAVKTQSGPLLTHTPEHTPLWKWFVPAQRFICLHTQCKLLNLRESCCLDWGHLSGEKNHLSSSCLQRGRGERN